MSVYFARVKGYVKIGYSADPMKRMSSIAKRSRTAPADVSPSDEVDPLGWIPGDRSVERRMHMSFGHLHVIGEWFWDDDAFDDFLRSHDFAVLPHDLSIQAVVLMEEFPHVPRATIVEACAARHAESLGDPASDTSLAVAIFGGSETAEAFRRDLKTDHDVRRAADRARWRSLRQVAS
jgi:hypothetical protein